MKVISRGVEEVDQHDPNSTPLITDQQAKDFMIRSSFWVHLFRGLGVLTEIYVDIIIFIAKRRYARYIKNHYNKRKHE